jgi:putative transposase
VDVGQRSQVIKALGLAHSTAYYQGSQTSKDDELAERIRAVLTEHKHYGHKRVALELGIGKNRARRVMRAYDLSPAPSPHQRHYKQHSGIRSAPPNLLKVYKLFIVEPNTIWACDFTYLRLPRLNRWYYLATVIDLYDRVIVGWSISIHHDSELILAALYDALSGQVQPWIIHFDRGSEYLSEVHLNLLVSLNINPSASKKASPWQNGHQERFYGSFKTELGSLKAITNEGELFELIAVTMDYYNTKRLHTALNTKPMTHKQNYYKLEFIGRVTLTEVRDKVSKISGT